MDVDIHQLPIPDWGLRCPQCRYPLCGLPSHRCPECGLTLDMDEIVQPWVRVRDPRFSGHERPLPDFGLTCTSCGAALAGAASHACGQCGAYFDLEALRPTSTWFILDRELTRDLHLPAVHAMLILERVPHVATGEKTVREIYGGHGMTFTRLRVVSEFFFEVLWLLERARHDLEQAREVADQAWICQHCGEENPGHFEVCWSCEAER